MAMPTAKSIPATSTSGAPMLASPAAAVAHLPLFPNRCRSCSSYSLRCCLPRQGTKRAFCEQCGHDQLVHPAVRVPLWLRGEDGGWRGEGWKGMLGRLAGSLGVLLLRVGFMRFGAKPLKPRAPEGFALGFSCAVGASSWAGVL